MGMKIWAMEKLQRMLAAMHEPDAPTTFTGGRAGSLNTKGRGETELSQVLRNERLHGPSDRDPSQLMKDLVLFRGPFIYVHDVDEKTRPVMVREYPKVAKRQDGTWPQFRSAPLGKCPFIEEAPTEKELARMKEEEEQRNAAAAEAPVRTEKVADAEKVPQKQSVEQSRRQDNENKEVHRKEENDTAPADLADALKPFPVRPAPPRMKSIAHSIKNPLNKIGHWPMIREPAASGVQPSNVTSAIRSQMVSSAAAAPGAKAGVSKEVHELKRKVLERSNGSMTASTNTSSHRPVDAPMAKAASGASAGSKRPLEKTGHVQEEDTTQSEDNGSHTTSQHAHANVDRKGASQKKPVKEKQRDPKPGYCENCRDKFDDFDEVCFLLALDTWALISST
jgi:regulatory subunit for Cdc7p protein kinase